MIDILLLKKMLEDSNFWKFNHKIKESDDILYSNRSEIIEQTLQNFLLTFDESIIVKVSVLDFDIGCKTHQPIWQAYAFDSLFIRLFMPQCQNIKKRKTREGQINNIIQIFSHEYRHTNQKRQSIFGNPKNRMFFSENFLKLEKDTARKHSRMQYYGIEEKNSKSELENRNNFLEYIKQEIEIDAHAFELAIYYRYLQNKHENILNFIQKFKKRTYGHDYWVASYLRDETPSDIRESFMSKFYEFVKTI